MKWIILDFIKNVGAIMLVSFGIQWFIGEPASAASGVYWIFGLLLGMFVAWTSFEEINIKSKIIDSDIKCIERDLEFKKDMLKCMQRLEKKRDSLLKEIHELQATNAMGCTLIKNYRTDIEMLREKLAETREA
jgi:hypothetical protein